MWQNGLTAVEAFAVAFAMLAILKPMSHRLGWVDRPGDPLKIHSRPIPLSGGAGIALGAIAAIAFAGSAWQSPGPLASLIIPAVVTACVGAWDDIRGLKPSTRLVIEAAAAVLAGAAGLACGLFDLKPGTAMTFWIPVMFVIVAVGGINAMNMQDGMDGLAGSLALISSLGIAFAASHAQAPLLVTLALAQAGAVCAFLCFNLPPASVFLGDSGSYFLGFLVSVAALTLAVGHGTLAAYAGAALLVGLPPIDAAFAIVRRLARGQSPFHGDRGHLYDQLLARGVSPRMTLAFAAALQLTLVGAGVYLLGAS